MIDVFNNLYFVFVGYCEYDDCFFLKMYVIVVFLLFNFVLLFVIFSYFDTNSFVCLVVLYIILIVFVGFIDGVYVNVIVFEFGSGIMYVVVCFLKKFNSFFAYAYVVAIFDSFSS